MLAQIQFDPSGTQFTHKGQTYELRRLLDGDLSTCVLMINRAFSIWKHFESRSEETIGSFLKKDGFIIYRTNSTQPCGSVCLRNADPKISGDLIQIKLPHRIVEATLFAPQQIARQLQGKQFVYGYNLSVDTALARNGLGRIIVEHCFRVGKAAGYHGMIMETGKDTGWLVEWYKRLGFTILGEGALEGTSTQAVMMLKWF